MLDMAFSILDHLYWQNPAVFTVIALGLPAVVIIGNVISSVVAWLRRGRTGGPFDDMNM